MKININGSWQDISNIFTNVNGTWQSVSTAYVNVNGTWNSIFTTPVAPTPVTPTPVTPTPVTPTPVTPTPVTPTPVINDQVVTINSASLTATASNTWTVTVFGSNINAQPPSNIGVGGTNATGLSNTSTTASGTITGLTAGTTYNIQFYNGHTPLTSSYDVVAPSYVTPTPVTPTPTSYPALLSGYHYCAAGDAPNPASPCPGDGSGTGVQCVNNGASGASCSVTPTPVTPTPVTPTPVASSNRICSYSDYINLPAPNCMSVGACDPLGSQSTC